MLDDLLYAVILLLDRTWRDRPVRARKVARKYREGSSVMIPAWVGVRMNQPSVSGRILLIPGSSSVEWRPLGHKKDARPLTLTDSLGPAAFGGGKRLRPLAYAWDVWSSEEGQEVLFIDQPYGPEFAPLLSIDRNTNPGSS